jgi:hypothetical protein
MLQVVFGGFAQALAGGGDVVSMALGTVKKPPASADGPGWTLPALPQRPSRGGPDALGGPNGASAWAASRSTEPNAPGTSWAEGRVGALGGRRPRHPLRDGASGVAGLDIGDRSALAMRRLLRGSDRDLEGLFGPPLGHGGGTVGGGTVGGGDGGGDGGGGRESIGGNDSDDIGDDGGGSDDVLVYRHRSIPVSGASVRRVGAGGDDPGDWSASGPHEPAGWVQPWASAGIIRRRDPPPRQYHAAASVSRQHLLVTGGEVAGPLGEGDYRCSGDAFVLSLESSTWCQLPLANPTRRAGHAMVTVDGTLYLFGGRATGLPATKPFPDDLLRLSYCE